VVVLFQRYACVQRHTDKQVDTLIAVLTRQSQTADSAPGVANWGDNLSTRHFLVVMYADKHDVINIKTRLVDPDCKK